MDQKPTFNVVEPFDNILLIQMNVVMADSLRSYIFSFDEIDVDLYSLAEGLTDPRMWQRTLSQAGFLTERFENVVTVQLNPPMRHKLRDNLSCAIYDEEPELVALGKALESPEKCYQIRKQKSEKHPQHPRSQQQMYGYQPAGWKL